MKGSTRRNFLKRIGLSALSFLPISILSGCQKKADRPNIILIMADDFGYECLSCNDSISYQTPNIDKLAETGIRFTNCYSTPLCTPSRVQLMTGKYNFRNYTEFGTLSPDETTFAHLFKQAEYATCVAGKWQLVGHYEGSGYKGDGTYPKDAGFDEYCLWQVDKFGSRYWNPVIDKNGELQQNLEGKYGPDIICDFINDFVKKHQSQLFFVYYPMILTHGPFVPTPERNPTPESRHKNDKSHFPDMVTYTDKIIGRIVKNLDELGLRENTLVIFTGDNGTPRGIISELANQVIEGGKGKTTNSGTHVPLVANWQGKTPQNVVCEDLIDFTDFLPTLCQAGNVPLPANFQTDGRGFLPQLLGRRGNPREWIFCHYDPRWGKWKLKRFVRDKRWKLYQDGSFFDLQNDPLEENPMELDKLPVEGQKIKRKFEQILNKMRRFYSQQI